MTLEQVLSRLDGVTKSSATQYTALCPIHGDQQNSLSVGLSDDGRRILLNCFAGCAVGDIVKELDLNLSDLFIKQKTDETVYSYTDAGGALLYRKTRADYSDGTKAFFFSKPDGSKGVKGIQRVPYNLPAVMAAQTVYFVEGEKCCDAITKAGRAATTLDSGAKSKWLPEYASYFTGKAVIIIPDNDAPGMEYAQRIHKQLPGSKIVPIPGLAEKADIYDWLAAGHTMNEFDTFPPYAPTLEADALTEARPPTQAETLLNLVETTGADFFHSDTKDPYIVIPVDGHTEVWTLDGKDFKTWLNGLYYREIGRPVGNEAVTQTVSVLSAKARFDRPDAIPLSTRVAERDGVIWYDLTNSAWQAIKITAQGWSVEDNPPILFCRYRHQAPQVMPQPGGDINKILRYINLKHSKTLFLCWLVSEYIPGIPRPLSVFFGEKGAGKSTASERVKTMIDPSSLSTLTLQNDSRSMAVNLQQHYFLVFDNVSYINEETSDTLCRAITGGGIQQRQLFTNAEDYIFTFKRGVALNGINNVCTRADLLDRSLLVELERIPETERRELASILSAFEADRPAILGGILDTLSRAMGIYPFVTLDKLPRMADFARWGYAIGEALGGMGQTFLDEYAANRESQNTEAINSDPVATLLVEFMRERNAWENTVSALYSELSHLAALLNINTRSKSFPQNPASLGKRINGIKSNLEGVGITFKKWHDRSGNYISLSRAN